MIPITAQYGAVGRSRDSRTISFGQTCSEPWTLTKLTANSSLAREISRTSPQSRPCWDGTSKRSCPTAVRPIALRRWACSPGYTTNAQQTRNLASLLAVVESSDLVTEPMSPAAVNARELRRSYNRRIRLPRTLVEELARTTSLAQPEWVAARTSCDFVRFRPWLEKIIQLKRSESACLTTETAIADKPAEVQSSRNKAPTSAPLRRQHSTTPCSTITSPAQTAKSWPLSSMLCEASSSPW